MSEGKALRGETMFPCYSIEHKIARGGMGEVFRATAHTAHGTSMPVVIKRILPQLALSHAVVEMFSAEARLMTQLEHPNVVRVLDFGRGESNDYFMVLELVDGVDLGRLRRAFEAGGERVPTSLGLYIVQEVLAALGFAHRAEPGRPGLVHRDVSPENVLLSESGAVKVADFGVALVASGEPPGDEAPVVGKPGYMAPEQLIGGPIDARSDLFSVGVMLCELLTGATPFAGATSGERQARAYAGEIRNLRELCPDLPVEIELLIRRACAPDPAERFADAASMAERVSLVRRRHPPLSGAGELADAVRMARERMGSLGPPAPCETAGATLVGTETEGPGDRVFTLRLDPSARATLAAADRRT